MIINHKSICPSPTGEVRWGLDGCMRSNNNFYIKTKTKINPRRITLLLNSVNHISPHLSSPEGEGQLLCFAKDFFSQSHQPPPSLKPILTFPKRWNK